MMKKHIITIFAAILACALLLSGCASGHPDDGSTKPDGGTASGQGDGTASQSSADNTTAPSSESETAPPSTTAPTTAATTAQTTAATTSTTAATTSTTAATTSTTAPPVERDGVMRADGDASLELFSGANAARSAVGKSELTYDSELEAVAYEYAELLYGAGKDFRDTTDYKTLPSGEKVYSLMDDYGGKVYNFGYSVWKNNFSNDTETMEALVASAIDSGQFDSKLAQGAATRVGIACAASTAGEDPYTVIVAIYLSDTP